ncbi:TetR family transcriptional regulator [Micromonospora sagamiensis]|uniref:TetR family transcriptional regulator n=1 Tax=Micromonospora sagamiensis TaxID=47875 RepID=A0A562WFE5_9ACTN|nr:TetR family transcriptional regulator [Micromonospora sagamiensis]TWJ28908.1 TetR family transcriptional regulator [Micromonospora sagamiensis]BCL18065.1 TetR family transcriptional regulator [Micromonospora sagamiensis]
MADEDPGDTRGRILRTALDLFSARGYQRTSLREIAERLRLTKAAILYHFPTKEDLLAALVEPLLTDLEALLAAAGGLPPERGRWALLEGFVDTMLAHRRPLGMLFHDMALVARGPTYQRLVQFALRANEIVAGPHGDRRDRIRASQAIAMCSDPVVFFLDVPPDVLRADMLDGVHRLLDGPPAPEVPTGPRRPGRPRAMSSGQIATARRMHAAGRHSVEEIAAALGVSRATVYRHLGDE